MNNLFSRFALFSLFKFHGYSRYTILDYRIPKDWLLINKTILKKKYLGYFENTIDKKI